MKNNIHYSPESLNDLDEIWEYIFSELCNPQAAENTVNNIMDAVDKLEDFSEIGAPLSSVTGIESDYRFLVSGNYMAFYRVIEREVYIDRVLYGRRDYLRILFPDLPQSDMDN
ncbi:MAG: type II toxin-antitoxin system RelE/ParE family toxin [Eubacteriales bacterium]|nr:type II toxin-antitoxin system RelE/ParE family toxin [Eubacteriales bacterium]